MRLVLSNAGLSEADFNLACFFVNSVFTGCERDGDRLLFPDMTAEEAVRISYYDDIGTESMALEYTRQRARQICMDMIALRGECKNPAGKFKLEVMMSTKERYNGFINLRREKAKDSLLLQAGEYQCPDSGFGVIAAWDTDNCLLWFEVYDHAPWEIPEGGIPEETFIWCLSQGVSACESAHEANEILYKAIGHDAFISGFDESEY